MRFPWSSRACGTMCPLITRTSVWQAYLTQVINSYDDSHVLTAMAAGGLAGLPRRASLKGRSSTSAPVSCWPSWQRKHAQPVRHSGACSAARYTTCTWRCRGCDAPFVMHELCLPGHLRGPYKSSPFAMMWRRGLRLRRRARSLSRVAEVRAPARARRAAMSCSFSLRACGI
jgi:hypothetical protein